MKFPVIDEGMLGRRKEIKAKLYTKEYWKKKIVGKKTEEQQNRSTNVMKNVKISGALKSNVT